MQIIDNLKEKVENAREHFEGLREVASSVHQKFITMIKHESERNVIRKRTCIDAVARMRELVISSGCATSIRQFLESTNQTQRTEAVNSFCSTCSANFTATLNLVSTDCARAEFNFTLITNLQFYPAFLCQQENNQNCGVVFVSATASTNSFTATINATDIERTCSPCVIRSISLLQRFVKLVGDTYYRKVAIFRALCVKNNNQFCFVALQNAVSIFGSFVADPNNPQALDRILDVTCSPCFRLVAARLALSDGISGLDSLEFIKTIGRFCRKDKTEYCLTKVRDALQTYISAPNSFPCTYQNNSNTCSQQCKDLVSDLLKKGGCCWGVIIDFMGTTPELRERVKTWLETCYGSSLRAPCSSYARAKLTITYSNIYATDILNNKAQFLNYVAADIAITIGGVLSIETSTATVVAGNSNQSITVEIFVTVPSEAQDVLNQTIMSEDNVNQNTQSANPSNGGVSANLRSSEVTTVISSSSSLSFGFLLIALLLFFLF